MQRNPTIYEINAWVWLSDVSERCGRPVTLADIPAEIVDEIAAWKPSAVWMMGVWERSPRGRDIALAHEGLQFEYEKALPGFRAEDVVGSPYSIHRYVVDEHYGGRDGLATFRAQLRERNIDLILDYVPNHVAVDHPWTVECPNCLVQGTEEDLKALSSSYFKVPNGAIFAHGRDPNWPAWTDTAQIDCFSVEGRNQALATVMDIADQCDGVRCDMAMLMVNSVFARVWARPADEIPPTEYWTDIIGPVKNKYSHFIFIAEVYWGMESDLQGLGFDFTYDKRLYDRLERDNVQVIREHLLGASSYQRKLVRFLENHDEARAMASFGLEKEQAAAVVIGVLPGAKLWHDGQFEGRKVRIPVQLGRRPKEATIPTLVEFYRRLTAELKEAAYHDGVCMALATHPMRGGDAVHQNLITVAWALGSDWRLVVVNYSDQPVEGRVMLPRPDLAGLTSWRFNDALHETDPILVIGDDLLTSGLPVSLPPYDARMFVITKAV